MTPRKESSFPRGSWMGTGVGGEAFFIIRTTPLEVGAGAVHLVDHGEAGNAEFIRLAPHRLGLRLHAADRAEDRPRAVEKPEGNAPPRS